MVCVFFSNYCGVNNGMVYDNKCSTDSQFNQLLEVATVNDSHNMGKLRRGKAPSGKTTQQTRVSTVLRNHNIKTKVPLYVCICLQLPSNLSFYKQISSYGMGVGMVTGWVDNDGWSLANKIVARGAFDHVSHAPSIIESLTTISPLIQPALLGYSH